MNNKIKKEIQTDLFQYPEIDEYHRGKKDISLSIKIPVKLLAKFDIHMRLDSVENNRNITRAQKIKKLMADYVKNREEYWGSAEYQNQCVSSLINYSSSTLDNEEDESED